MNVWGFRICCTDRNKNACEGHQGTRKQEPKGTGSNSGSTIHVQLAHGFQQFHKVKKEVDKTCDESLHNYFVYETRGEHQDRSPQCWHFLRCLQYRTAVQIIFH